MSCRSENTIAIASIIFCLLLSPCVLAAPAASSSAAPASSIFPFAATGLLVRPDERAEEILLRAHARDTRAMALVVAGYSRGMGGFPKDFALAAAWGGQLASINALGAASFFTLQMWEEEKISDEDLGFRLANCRSAREWPLNPLFKKAGIFDVEQFCADLERRKDSVPGVEKRARQIRDGANTLTKKGHASMAAIRAFRDRPAAKAELKGLSEALTLDFLPFSTLISYAATTHDPEKEAPDWSAERLFTFLNALSPQAQINIPRQSRGFFICACKALLPAAP